MKIVRTPRFILTEDFISKLCSHEGVIARFKGYDKVTNTLAVDFYLETTPICGIRESGDVLSVQSYHLNNTYPEQILKREKAKLTLSISNIEEQITALTLAKYLKYPNPITFYKQNHKKYARRVDYLKRYASSSIKDVMTGEKQTFAIINYVRD